MTKGDRTIDPSGAGRRHPAFANENVSHAAPKKPGRKPGKHSNDNYTQTSIYLPIDLRNRVRARLYERGMEMSGLVENMLREWLGKEVGVEGGDTKS